MKNIPISDVKFGWSFVVIFAIIFLYAFFKYAFAIACLFAALALIFAMISIFSPSTLSPVNVAWTKLSLALATITTPITLGLIFFLFIVPVALIVKLHGRDALSLKKRHVTSYWVDREPVASNSFKHQF